ncbi:thioesterase family protein [soil metagenome]
MTAADGQVAADGWYRVRVPVRFRDLDAMGHAHHTLPLIYLEEARARFWALIRGSSAVDAIEYVMAEITLRFHARIMYPGDVVVGLAVRRVGGSSFTTDFEVRSDAGVLLSSGSAVHVAYDYDASASRSLTEVERAGLQAWHDAAAR